MQQTGGNLMVVKTQQTGVNPGTKVTCSHMPTSKEARARVGSTHPNQDERSDLGNVSGDRVIGRPKGYT